MQFGPEAGQDLYQIPCGRMNHSIDSFIRFFQFNRICSLDSKRICMIRIHSYEFDYINSTYSANNEGRHLIHCGVGMCDEEGGEVYHVNPHDRRARRRACLAVGGMALFPAIERCQRDFGCLSSMPFCKLLIAEPDRVSRGSSLPEMRQLQRVCWS